MREDIKNILKGLTDKDPSDSIAEEKTIKFVDGLENSYTLIDELRIEIQRIKDFRGDREPFYNLYLSVAYLIQKDFKSAKEVLGNAVQDFQIQGFSINEALGEWLFGIIHFESGNNERAQRACENAVKIMKQLIKQCEEEGKYEKAKVYKKHLKQMERFQKNIRNHSKRNLLLLLGASQQTENSKAERKIQFPKLMLGTQSKSMPPQGTPFRSSQQEPLISLEHEQKHPHDDGPPRDGSRSIGDSNYEPLVEHIVIPVDLRALQDLSPKLHILNPELFDNLKSYEAKIVNSDGQNKTRSKPKPTPLRRVTIPSFPLYGQVAAGPNGEPNLDSSELGMAEAVNDDVYINLEGQKHEVTFINNEQTTFISGRRYGWLKVIGQSMNDSYPIINDSDYVLFSENHDASSCVFKIVVAGLPETDDQPPQLVVKRLLKTENLRTDHPPEYVLHSESTLDKDPRTEISYKQDIRIINNNQLGGVVVALAKPI